MLGGKPLPTAAVQTIIVPDPAAGAQWFYTFPAGYQVLLLGLQYRFVTAAAAAWRYPGYAWNQGGFPLAFRVQYAVGIPANQNYICNWLVGCSYVQTVTVGIAPLSGTHQMTLAFPIVFNPTDVLNSDIIQIQAADQITDIRLYYLEMPLTQ